jgi:hypothetical protein
VNPFQIGILDVLDRMRQRAYARPPFAVLLTRKYASGISKLAGEGPIAGFKLDLTIWAGLLARPLVPWRAGREAGTSSDTIRYRRF